MVATVGSLNVNATLQTAQFDRDLDKLKGKFKGLQSSFASMGSRFTSIGKTMSVAITAPLTALAAAGIKEAQETATAMAQVNASLASMGPVAGRSAKQLQDFANALELKSTFEADEILKDVTATMLTFGNVTGETFDRAQQAAVDLATKFGKGLPEAAVMVGKALQDPIRGITALGRTGIQFSDSQKAVIKSLVETGQTAKAQALILSELERQVKGSAAAAQDADPWNKLSDAFKSIAESVGALLLPLIPPLADALSGVAQWVSSLDPTTQKWVVGIGAAAAAMGPLLVVLGTVTSAAGNLIPLVVGLSKGWGLLTTGLAALAPVIATVSRALLALLANPVLLGAAVVVVGIYEAWKHWDEISAIAQRVYQGVKTWIADKLGAVLDWASKKVREFATPFVWLYDKLVGHSVVPDMIDGISEQMQRLHGVMVAPAVAAAKATGDAFDQMKARVADVFDRLFPDNARYQQFVTELAEIEAVAKRLGLTADQTAEAIRRLRQEYTNEAFGGTGEPPIMSEDISLAPQQGDLVISEAPGSGQSGGLAAAGGMFSAMRDAADGLSDAITDVIMGTKSLGDAFGEMAKQIIADIIRMTIRMLIMQAIMSIIKGLAGGGPGFAGGGSFEIPGLAKGGSFNVPGFAAGGSFGVGGFAGVDKNMLSLNGLPLARVSRGERIDIIPESERNRGSAGTVHYHFEGNLMTPEFWQRIQEGDLNAANMGSMLAVQRMKDINRRR